MALSKLLLNVLIDHIDGPLPVGNSVETFAHDIRARGLALRSGLLRYVDDKIPRHTVMTDKGRKALCADLATMAEILLRAKFIPEFCPPAGLALPSVSPDSIGVRQISDRDGGKSSPPTC